jgi:hypothetical protein
MRVRRMSARRSPSLTLIRTWRGHERNCVRDRNHVKT